MDVTGLSLDSDVGRLGGGGFERRAGRWSAWFVVAISVAYAAIMVAGFGSLGNLTDPLPDPYLAVAELLILLMAPVMVVLMAALHACAPVHLRMFSMIAFGWMLVAACLTMTVHVVELVVARRVDPGAVPGFARLFDFAWPSMLYAVDVVAWDLMLGLSLLFAAFVFTGRRHRGITLGSAGERGPVSRRTRRACDRCVGVAGPRDRRLCRDLPRHLHRAGPRDLACREGSTARRLGAQRARGAPVVTTAEPVRPPRVAPPRSIAVRLFNEPDSLPIGVRAPPTMTEPDMATSPARAVSTLSSSVVAVRGRQGRSTHICRARWPADRTWLHRETVDESTAHHERR